ncbi:MAG: hypothetical protein SFV19_12370 [Rhodospirillaceae bacterium]|nr:hypothetical protein [Rhodospirillaceae bacterium]
MKEFDVQCAPQVVRFMLSALWLGVVLPSVTPHCDVVAQGLHDLVAHSHAPHADHHHHPAPHAALESGRSGELPPVNQQCEVKEDTVLADAASGVKATVKSSASDGGGALDVAERFPHDLAAAGPPAPPRWRGHAVSPDHFQRNHRLLI